MLKKLICNSKSMKPCLASRICGPLGERKKEGSSAGAADEGDAREGERRRRKEEKGRERKEMTR
jgi:hypothetical protein